MEALFLMRGETFGAVKAIAYGGFEDKNRNGSVTDRGDAQAEVAYVGTKSSLLLRPATGGRFQVLRTYEGGAVQDIVLDPLNWKTAYVLDELGSVWRTTNAGATKAGWTNLTGNLKSLSKNLRTIEFVRTGNKVVLLVGGLGGVFRAINPTNNSIWTELGERLPNTIVTDLHYNEADNILVAGTFGRGAWILPDARTNVAFDGILKVPGSDGVDDVVVLIRNQDEPWKLDVFVNPQLDQSFKPQAGQVPFATVQLSAIQRIEVTGGSGNDTLIVDTSNGPIGVTDVIFFDGQGDSDTLRLQGPGGISRSNPQPSGTDGKGTSQVIGEDPFQILVTQRINFLHLEHVNDQLTTPFRTVMSVLGKGWEALAESGAFLRQQLSVAGAISATR